MPFLSKPVEQTGGEGMIHYQFDPFLLKLAHSLIKNASGGLAVECHELTFELHLCAMGTDAPKLGWIACIRGIANLLRFLQFYGLEEKSAKALFLSKSNSIHSCASALALAGAIIKTQKTGQTQQDSGRVPTIPSGHLNCSGAPPIYV